MQQLHKINHLALGFLTFFLIMALTITLVIPINAQGGMFATNTPEGASNTDDISTTDAASAAPAIFATNTPEGMVNTTSDISTPEAPLFNYGMRFWLESDFVALVSEQVQSLQVGDTDAQLASNILLYEMEQRFPAAPRDAIQREALIAAMLNAPIGALDMRQIVRPFVQNAINANASNTMIEINGFTITLTPANLDGLGALDRVVNVLYQDDAGIRYEEYLLATANESGSFTLLNTNYDLPAVPFDGIEAVSIEHLRDVNADSLDELVLRVKDGVVSDRLFILEYRNGNAVDLVDPALELRVGAIVNWVVDLGNTIPPDLTVLEYQAVSAYPNWQCANQIEYTWQFERNLYRRTQDLNARLSNVDSLGCTLANADLFSLPTSDAITIIETALLGYGFDAPSANRALMTLAMMYTLSGRLDDARNTAQSVITAGDDTTWESQQANALLRALSISGNTALDICEALAIANEFPACDVNAVIGTYLDFVDLTTDSDLETQLNAVGLPVLESVEVSEIGRATRTVLTFNLFDSGWWGFLDAGNGTYRFEPAEAPAGFAESIFPVPLTSAPTSAIDALLVDNDPARVLAILDNTLRENPDVPLAPSAVYLQALASEFTGDRDSARSNYYAIWEMYPEQIWGQISATHLELR
ncbi:MAG: hypothetical protein WBC91_02100 [Phototrophicaceae bacterium]